MKYIDIGYAVALGSLFLYAVGLVARRRRLQRASANQDDPGGIGP